MTSAANPPPLSNGNDWWTEPAGIDQRYRFYQKRSYPAFNHATWLLLHTTLQSSYLGHALDLGCGQGGVGLHWLFYHHAQRVHFLDNQFPLLKVVNHNLRHNGLTSMAVTICADFSSLSQLYPAHFFNTIALNPPFYSPASSRSPNHPLKAKAHSISDNTLKATFQAISKLLVPKGLFFCIYPVAFLTKILYIMQQLRLHVEEIRFFSENDNRTHSLCVLTARKNSRKGTRVVFLPAQGCRIEK